jgi:hypothetical protein
MINDVQLVMRARDLKRPGVRCSALRTIITS